MGDAIHYTSLHKSQVVRWGIGALAALLLAGGAWWFWSYQKANREADLRDAFLVSEATVGKESTPFTKNFATQQAKDDAVLKAFTDVAAKDSGTKEGDVAAFYTAGLKNEKGDTNTAIVILKGIVDGGRPVSSIARLSLANLYAGQGKYLEAETLVKSLVDRPTSLVSKEHAQIQLAEILGKHDPEAAKKLLASIKVPPSPVSSTLERSIETARAGIDRR